MKRIVVVASSLDCGGAEKVVSLLCNHWANKGCEVTLITLMKSARGDFFSVSDLVKRRSLDIVPETRGLVSRILNFPWQVRLLRSELRTLQPDEIVSFVDWVNVITLVAATGRTPVVISERTDPAAHEISIPLRFLRRRLYRRANTLVLVCKSAAPYFNNMTIPTLVIPNPAPCAPPVPSRHGEKKTVVAIGRLVHCKGFDILIKAFAKISNKHPTWTLVIYGEGPLRKSLEGMIYQEDLSERACLPGRIDIPLEKMSKADLFVLSSRYEGFPNALIEAMSTGLPVIAFDCPGANREIVDNNINGVLISGELSAESLAVALDRLMSDSALREKLGTAAAASVKTRFSEELFFTKWDAVIGLS